MTAPGTLGKGAGAEEALRNYFLSQGYFVVRAVPFNYKGFAVTDVDLWLYMKSSSLACERTCVDVKRKKTPQAIERVLWTKGLREVLGLDRAVVVTTDNRKETREFGAQHSITVLPGDFLQRVVHNFSSQSDRISEELFINELRVPCIFDTTVYFTRFYNEAKATLISGLNFNGCNILLNKLRFIIQEYIASNKTSKASLRLLYVLMSYLIVTIDYSSRVLIHLDIIHRKEILEDGFRYGESGRERTQDIVNTALHLLTDFPRFGLISPEEINKQMQSELLNYPADILAEYFSRPEILKRLFLLSREFDKLAYSIDVPPPHECPSELKGILGLLCDFFKLPRRDVI